jgi:hypothetical protein
VINTVPEAFAACSCAVDAVIRSPNPGASM